MLVAQSCLTLCDPMDCSPPGSSVCGILHQEYWSGLPYPSLGESSQPRNRTWDSCTAGKFLPSWPFLWTACWICTVHFTGLRATRLPLLQPLEVNAALLTPCPSLPSRPGSFKTLIILVLSTPCLSFGRTPLPGSKVWPQCPRQEPQCPEAVPASPHSPLFPFSTSSSKTSPSSAKIRLSS